MNEKVVERVIAASTRGMVEAFLAFYSEQETKPAPKRHKRKDGVRGARTEPVEELSFPSIARMENGLFGEMPPPDDADLDMALSALAQARAQEAASAIPTIQPGPGESETTEWARIPQ